MSKFKDLDLTKVPTVRLDDLNDKVLEAVTIQAMRSMHEGDLPFTPTGVAARTTAAISDLLKGIGAMLETAMVLGPDVREQMIQALARGMQFNLLPAKQQPLPPRPKRPTRLVLKQREIDEVTYTLVQDLDMAVCGVGDGLKHDCQPGFKGIPLGLEVVSVLEPSCGDPWLVTVRILQEPSVTPATQAAFNSRMATYGFLPRA